MSVQLAPPLVFKDWTNNGLPLAFGTVMTYIAGSTTPQATWVDSTQTTQNTNPITLNSRGEANIWLDPTLSYKFVVKDSAGNTIRTVDNVNGLLVINSDLIPGITNTYTLGSPTVSWANLYLGPNNIPVYDSFSGGIGYYALTAQEQSLSITPFDFFYGPWDPRRYDADPSGLTVSTLAVQTCINVQSPINGRVYIAAGCNYLTGPLVWQATAENSGIYFEGDGSGGSRLTYTGITGTHLSYLGTAADIANSVASTVHITMRGITMVGTGALNTTNGILLQALSQWIFDDVVVVEYGDAYNLSSALVGDFWSCIAENCANGYISSKLGSNEACNDISIREGRVIGCSTWGFDIGNGQGWTIDGTDIESNGTAGNPATGAIMLRSSTSTETGIAIFDIRAWIEQNNGWSLYAENNSGLQLSVHDRVITARSESSFTASISTTTLSVPGTVTGVPLAAGAYLSGASITPGTKIVSGSGTSWVVNISQSVSSEAMTASLGGVINIQGALSVDFENIRTGSTLTDVAIVNAVVGRVTNSVFSNWVDTGVTYPYYEGAFFNLGSEQDGRITAQAWTMTGGSTATGTVGITQQGHRVIVNSGGQIANSSGTATTISVANAVPSNLQPVATRSGLIEVLNNGAITWGQWTLSTGGTLTLTAAGGNFTNAGQNGVPIGAEFSYSL